MREACPCREWVTGPSQACRALSALQPAALHVIVPLRGRHYSVKGQLLWLSRHWHACSRLKMIISCMSNACACQQASKWLEKICRCQQRLLPLRWLHVRSNCNSRLQGKRKLQIEFLVALAPQLLVADLLEPWNSHETVPYGPYQRCGNSITRRLCAESLHHLRVRVPPGFDLQIIAGGLPKVQTLHFECQEPLDYLISGELGLRTLDISRNTACQQLYLGNILPGSLIVPHSCQVYLEANLHTMAQLLGSWDGIYRSVVGLKLHLNLDDDAEDESVLQKLPKLCAAFPRVTSLIMHMESYFEAAFGKSGHIDLQALAAFQHLTALQITCDVEGAGLTPDWQISVPSILSVTRLSIEILGALPEFHLHMPILGTRLHQLAVYTEHLDELFTYTTSRGLSERGLRLGALRVEGSSRGLPACHFLMPSNCVDPPACSLGNIHSYFQRAVDIPWASCGQFVDQLPSSSAGSAKRKRVFT